MSLKGIPDGNLKELLNNMTLALDEFDRRLTAFETNSNDFDNRLTTMQDKIMLLESTVYSLVNEGNITSSNMPLRNEIIYDFLSENKVDRVRKWKCGCEEHTTKKGESLTNCSTHDKLDKSNIGDFNE